MILDKWNNSVDLLINKKRNVDPKLFCNPQFPCSVPETTTLFGSPSSHSDTSSVESERPMPKPYRYHRSKKDNIAPVEGRIQLGPEIESIKSGNSSSSSSGSFTADEPSTPTSPAWTKYSNCQAPLRLRYRRSVSLPPELVKINTGKEPRMLSFAKHRCHKDLTPHRPVRLGKQAMIPGNLPVNFNSSKKLCCPPIVSKFAISKIPDKEPSRRSNYFSRLAIQGDAVQQQKSIQSKSDNVSKKFSGATDRRSIETWARSCDKLLPLQLEAKNKQFDENLSVKNCRHISSSTPMGFVGSSKTFALRDTLGADDNTLLAGENLPNTYGSTVVNPDSLSLKQQSPKADQDSGKFAMQKAWAMNSKPGTDEPNILLETGNNSLKEVQVKKVIKEEVTNSTGDTHDKIKVESNSSSRDIRPEPHFRPNCFADKTAENPALSSQLQLTSQDEPDSKSGWTDAKQQSSRFHENECLDNSATNENEVEEERSEIFRFKTNVDIDMKTFEFPNTVRDLSLNFEKVLTLKDDAKQSISGNSGNFESKKGRFSRKVTFRLQPVIFKTYSGFEYDRRPEFATCNLLTPLLAHKIRQELNSFKLTMPVHEESKMFTQFF